MEDLETITLTAHLLDEDEKSPREENTIVLPFGYKHYVIKYGNKERPHWDAKMSDFIGTIHKICEISYPLKIERTYRCD